MSKIKLIVLLALAPAFVQAANPAPTVDLKSLSKELAHEAVLTAVKACAAKGYSVAAAVTDRSGNLQALLRDPLAGAHTVRTSERKAYTAASLQVATSSVAASNPELRHAPGILLIQGGVPISIAGIFYGGIAVSGADPRDDEKCAQAGVDAIAEVLEFAD